jgi:RNA polymerase sigma factor (sigma-70 family)
VRGEILITEKADSESREIDIEAYYLRYGPMVLRRCRQMLKEEQSACDAMQEVFLKVLSNQNRLKGTYPSALLYRIATNTCLNRIRNERKHTISEYLGILRNVSFFGNLGESGEAEKLLDYILRRERQTTQKIAVMYFINGMTIKEIAETTKLSISGVHKQLEKLRRKIKEKGEVS